MQVTVRPATSEDGVAMLAWRNDPEVRSVSRNSDPISVAEHRRWLAGALSDPDRIVLIAECGEHAACGMVRFDKVAAARWEVSLIISAECRGRGVGSRALSEALAYLRFRQPDASAIATINSSNDRSRALFERLGFRRTRIEGDFERFELGPAGA